MWRHHFPLLLNPAAFVLLILAQQSSNALSPPPLRIRALRQLSEKPLVFSIDDFMDVETCQALEEGEAHASYQDAVSLFATLSFCSALHWWHSS